MGADVEALLKLEVPVIVVLGRRTMTVRDVVALVPGAIVELPKNAEDDLELLVNNKPIGLGRAVKVGENFGIRLGFVGDLRKRLAALNQQAPLGASDDEAEALAAAMLAGQI
jgi:flagellar motor switch protein FliN/FliY